MRPQSAKAKGRRLQQWVRDQLIEHLEVHPEDIESRSMGAGGEDLIMSRSAREKFNFSIECKNVEKLNTFVYKQGDAKSTYDQLTNLVKLFTEILTQPKLIDGFTNTIEHFQSSTPALGTRPPKGTTSPNCISGGLASQEIELNKSEYKSGEPIDIIIKATDYNGNPLCSKKLKLIQSIRCPGIDLTEPRFTEALQLNAFYEICQI